MATHPRSVPLLICLAALGPARAFYLPGVSPREYREGEHVDLKVNKLTSTKCAQQAATTVPIRAAQAYSLTACSCAARGHRTQLPYEYYSLPFCLPDNMDTVAENLGEVLRGDKIMHSNCSSAAAESKRAQERVL